MHGRMSNPPRRQGGGTMIEVLITMVVISVGLLGNAALLSKSVKSNHTAYLRTQATLLAYDILERMRGNRPAALAGGYSLTFGSTPGSDFPGQDLSDWKGNVTNTLPSGEGSVAVDGQGNATIVLRWKDSSKMDGAGNALFTTFTTQSRI